MGGHFGAFGGRSQPYNYYNFMDPHFMKGISGGMYGSMYGALPEEGVIWFLSSPGPNLQWDSDPAFHKDDYPYFSYNPSNGSISRGDLIRLNTGLIE